MRAVLCGYYGKGNGGDEALLASLLQMLPEGTTPLVLSGNPQQTHQRYGVASCDRFSAWQVWRALRWADVLILGGGSLIQDATSWRSPLYYAGLAGLARGMGVKTVAWAQGIGPLKQQVTVSLARRLFRGCAAASVRDRASASLLHEWGVPFTLAPDPVWALDAKPVPGLWDLPAPRVAVTLRSHPLLTPERLTRLTQALRDFQKATDAHLLLLPFHQTQDTAIAQTIHAQLPDTSTVLSLEDPRMLKGVFQGVEMAIGMRLHSLIMAAAQECRCFALSYDPKVTQLMAELNLPGWELDALPEDANTISHAWIDWYANGDPLSPAQIQSLSDRSWFHGELLQSLFAKTA